MRPASEDETWMDLALEAAERGKGWVNPNPMVGAVVVRDGRAIAVGHHPRVGEAHAEVMALREAGERARGATLYVTLEPCNHHGRTGPCTEAILASGVSRVVWAVDDPNPRTAGQAEGVLGAAGVETGSGVRREAAQRLNEGFFAHVRRGAPFVVAKMAMSLDGKIATSTGASRWITGETSRAHVHGLRAWASVVMVGINTVLADDPRLDARLPGAHQPERLVVDPLARTPLNARLFELDRPLRLWVGPLAPADRVAALAARGAKITVLPVLSDGHLDLAWGLAALGREEVSIVLLEGGGGLVASAVGQGVVDKVVFFVAPLLIGGKDSPSPLEGVGLGPLDVAPRLHGLRSYPSGEDVRLEAYLAAHALE